MIGEGKVRLINEGISAALCKVSCSERDWKGAELPPPPA